MNIQDVRTAPRSPWQNAYVERVIGSIRRECLDHVMVMNAAGLQRMLNKYVAYPASTLCVAVKCGCLRLRSRSYRLPLAARNHLLIVNAVPRLRSTFRLDTSLDLRSFRLFGSHSISTRIPHGGLKCHG
jgi:transposase InsO family protein